MASAMMRRTWQHIREVFGANRRMDISRADVRLELSDYGLLGREFSIQDECLPAVTRSLGLKRIFLEPYPDQHEGVVTDDRLEEGVLADVSYNAEKNEAIILVRESLKTRPWPTFELCVLHELSHLIGKHHLKTANLKLQESTIRESWNRPQSEQDELEVEARKHAKLLLLAQYRSRSLRARGDGPRNLSKVRDA